MKIKPTLLILTTIGTAAITWYLLRKKSTKKMLDDIADEGYETAGDILYPGKNVTTNLHYGPVITR